MGAGIRYEVVDRVATITVDRPERKGAMTYALLGEFIDVVARAGADDDAHVVILTGTPGCFCAGTDLADLASVPGERRGLRGTAEEGHRWWPVLACPKPTIAAIDGPAVGMGAEFTSQCDLRVELRPPRPGARHGRGHVAAAPPHRAAARVPPPLHR
jgi:enoyl-CoA hydratase